MLAGGSAGFIAFRRWFARKRDAMQLREYRSNQREEAMAETKTREPTVERFLETLDDPQKRLDSDSLVTLMQKITGKAPAMWGSSIVGFGRYHYKYDSGHEGESCLVGFSPRKAEFSIYLNGSHWPEQVPARDELLQRLGKHRMGKGCLYVKRLEGIDLAVLERLIRQSVEAIRHRYGEI
jgi:hypothetical protein